MARSRIRTLWSTMPMKVELPPTETITHLEKMELTAKSLQDLKVPLVAKRKRRAEKSHHRDQLLLLNLTGMLLHFLVRREKMDFWLLNRAVNLIMLIKTPIVC